MATTTVSLLPAEVDVYVEQGTDVTLQFQLKKYESSAWVAESIASDAVKFTVKDDWGGVTKVTTKTNASNQHLDAANGITKFSLSKTELTTADPGSDTTWRYEVRRVVAGTLEEIVYIRGKLVLGKTIGTGTVPA